MEVSSSVREVSVVVLFGPAKVGFSCAEEGDVIVIDVVTQAVPSVGIVGFDAVYILKGDAKGVRRWVGIG